MYRIYIVEDDSKISAVLKRNMEKYGFDAACASEFRDIVPELEVYEPHLVMLDINLPYFDGYYWCRQIRKNPTYRSFSYPLVRVRWIRCWP